MTNKEYHSKKEYLSSTNIKALPKGRKNFELSLLGIEPTDSMNLGSAVHTMFLEPQNFDSEFIIAPKIDRRTKQGKLDFAKFQSESEGKIVLTQNQAVELENIREALMDSNIQPKNGDIIENSYFGEIMGVKAKCRPDLLKKLDDGTYNLIDLKTTSDIHSFKRSFFNFGYDLQFAFYDLVLDGNFMTCKEYSIIAVENKAPYNVQVFNISKDLIELAKKKVFALIEIYKNIENIPFALQDEKIDVPNWY